MKKILILTIAFFIVDNTLVYSQSTTAKKAPSKPAVKTNQSNTVTPVRKTAPASPTLSSKPSTSANPPAKAPAKQATTTVQTQNKPVQPQTSQPTPVRQTPQYAPTSPVSTRSSSYAYAKGDKLLNVGIGLSSYYYGNPIGISFESGIDKDISFGAQLDYNSGNYYGYYGGYTAYYLGARGSFHFNRILNIRQKKIDLYAGIGLGYQRFRWNDSSYGYGYSYGYRSGLFFNYFIGGKYYFTDKVGAFVELGYTGLASSRVGITFKFK